MPKSHLATLFAVLIAAVIFRVAGNTFDSLWLDEGYQSIVDAVGRPLPDFFSVPEKPFVFRHGPPASPQEMLANFRTVDPLTPPLYQLLLNRWMIAFGDGDFAVRTLSAVISTAGVGCLFALAYWAFGFRAALCSGLLQAFSPFEVYYGQEVRMYALEELTAIICVGSLFLFLWGTFSRRARTVLLAVHAVGAWALINTHYTGLFVFAGAIAIGGIVAMGRRSWKMIAALMASWFATALLWIPWFSMFKQAAALRTASFYVARKPTWWWPVAALFFRIPANWVTFVAGKQVVGWALPLYATSIALILLIPLQALAPRLVQRSAGSFTKERRSRWLTIALMGWALIPAVVLWALDVVENHRVIEMSRYLIGTAPPIFVLAGAALSSLNWRGKLPWILLSAHLLFCTVNNVAHCTVIHQREPWREMARVVEQNVPPGELLLVSQYYDIVCLNRYLNVPYKQVGVSSQTTTAQLERLLQGARSFALVTAQEGDRVINAIPPRFKVTKRVDELGRSLHFLMYLSD